MKAIKTKKKVSNLDDGGYCKVCGTCGFIDCCGIRDFIEKHVRGKTNCSHEKHILDEIIENIEHVRDEFMDRIIKAQQEGKDGKGISGDLEDLIKQV